jgi:hypothetical protein
MFRSLEKVAQRSTVGLAVVREIADRRCARSRDAPLRLPTKSASTKRPFHLQHVANLKKSPGMKSSLFSTSTTMGVEFARHDIFWQKKSKTACFTSTRKKQWK